MRPILLAGPISSASPDGPGAFGYIVFALFACFVVRSLLRDWRRTKQIRDYAQNKGLVYIGASLPKSFPFGNTSVSRAAAVINVTAGDQNGKELLFFDCRLGSGKGRRTQTVVAFGDRRSSLDQLALARF